jgi:hypothetical protein
MRGENTRLGAEFVGLVMVLYSYYIITPTGRERKPP